MYVGLVGRIVHPGHLKVVEIRLVDLAGGRGDLAGPRKPYSHHGRTLELRTNAVRVDDHTSVDDLFDARNPKGALGIDLDLDDGRDVAVEAAVRGNAHPAAAARLAVRPS